MNFTCEELGSSKIELWLGDCGLDVNLNNHIEDNERNWAYVDSKIIITDSLYSCTLCCNPEVKGSIVDQWAKPLGGISVSITQNKLSDITNVDGKFTFLLPCFKHYTFSARNEENDYFSHINENDFQALTDHLIGKKLITDPYLLIAADINQDKKINVSDLYLLSK